LNMNTKLGKSHQVVVAIPICFSRIWCRFYIKKKIRLRELCLEGGHLQKIDCVQII
jgi:hypothetical protein